jgi:hypothetical protein
MEILLALEHLRMIPTQQRNLYEAVCDYISPYSLAFSIYALVNIDVDTVTDKN